MLSEWISARPDRHDPSPLQAAWLSLDKGDNDPTRFWTYVLAALQTTPDLCKAGVGASALSMLQSPQPPPIEALLTTLINDVAEHAARPSTTKAAPHPVSRRDLVLVLDDFHEITNAQVNEALTFLLDNLPPHTGPPIGTLGRCGGQCQGMHLVIATRADPPLPLSRLRGRGQLTELGAADLRFTPDEAATFLNRVMGLDLSIENVSALEARTEGWAVGLQLAARALQSTRSTMGRDAAPVSDFISAFTGSHRYILDYLADEVLSRESQAIQTFLLQTSILKRLAGPLCDALTGQDDGQDMLERLDAANLFVVPMDAERRWYRYHHLFADLLARRLGRAYADLVPELHRRASEWYEDAGAIESAIDHALAGKDFERAARLVEQHAVRQMMTFRKEAALAEWLKALPEALVRARPWLCVYLGWTRYWMGMRDQVEECLLQAEHPVGDPARPSEPEKPSSDSAVRTQEQLIAGYVAAIRSHHALTNREIPRVIEMAQKAIAYLPRGDYMRCEAAVALGGAYWSLGDVVASLEAFTQAWETAQQSGYPPLSVPSGCYVGMQQEKQGHLHEARETYRAALACAAGPGGIVLPVGGFPLIRLGNLSREWNDLDAARRDLAQGMELCVQLGQADVLAEAHVMLARLQLAQGDHKAVPDTLHKVDQITSRSKIDPWITCWADECRLQRWLSTGHLARAIRWAQASGLAVDGELDYQLDLHHLNLARVWVARGIEGASETDLLGAQRLLERLLAAARKAGWVNREIEILILSALALDAQGSDEQALAALEQALVLARPGGYVRTFVDGGAPVARLLRRAVAHRIAPGYADRLLSACAGGSTAQAPPAVAQPSALAEPLSEREIEVLGLVAQGLSNREIGERLFITQGTVKAHTSNIYGKLGVRSRTQAVAQAQALGIL